MDESNENAVAGNAAGTESTGVPVGTSPAAPSVEAGSPVELGSPERADIPVASPGRDVVTGDAGVDAVLSGLERVPALPVSEHASAYADLHDGLLAALNEEPGAGSPLAPKQGLPAGPGDPGNQVPAPFPGQGSKQEPREWMA